MKTNREIRNEAWKILWRERWIGRLAVGYILLGAVLALVLGGLNAFFGTPTAGTGEAGVFQLAMVLFRSFMQYLFTGLAMFGAACLALQAVRGRTENWLGSAFAGFQRPFAVCWLAFDVQIRSALWLLAALLPALVVAGLLCNVLGLPETLAPFLAAVPASFVFLWTFYRYLLVWYFKSDDPNLGSAECIRRSVETMSNLKKRAIGLDCSFWPWLLTFLPTGVACGWCAVTVRLTGFSSLSVVQMAAGVVALWLAAVLSLFLGCYMSLAHAVFYREALASVGDSSTATAGNGI